ncbi:hypothetical protein [Pseudoclavibacter soli]|uniref:hypothetical protein n=1 Tax=Pseudoclavibacter soli TaxID=452623 RepID=UPI000423ED66|nr:hypothetical protein [Pseudoclavibacter soli]
MAENTSESIETLKARLEKAVGDFEKFTEHTVKPLAQKGAEAVKPLAQKGADQAGKAAQVAKDRFYADVVPAAVAAVGTAKAVLEALKDAPASTEVRTKVSEGLEKAAEAAKPAKKRGVGRFILIGVAAAAAIGVGVAVVRAVTLADEHWIGIDDEFDSDAQ